MLLFELFIIRKFPPIVLNNLPLKLILIYKHFERKNASLFFIHKRFSICKMSGGQYFDNDLLTLYCRKHSNHFHIFVNQQSYFRNEQFTKPFLEHFLVLYVNSKSLWEVWKGLPLAYLLVYQRAKAILPIHQYKQEQGKRQMVFFPFFYHPLLSAFLLLPLIRKAGGER